jgi:hypothetical protein
MHACWLRVLTLKDDTALVHCCVLARMTARLQLLMSCELTTCCNSACWLRDLAEGRLLVKVRRRCSSGKARRAGSHKSSTLV